MINEYVEINTISQIQDGTIFLATHINNNIPKKSHVFTGKSKVEFKFDLNGEFFKLINRIGGFYLDNIYCKI